MDAVDLNWCLACGCRIELDVCTPYCSQNCLNSDQPSTSSHPMPSYHSIPSAIHREPEQDDYLYDDSIQDAHLASPSHNTWIGRGEAGIRAWAQSVPRGAPSDDESTPSGTLKPKLLQSRPVKPSLCMSLTQPAPPEPSRPILTPQQSLPSLSRDSTSAPSTSMVSLTTGSSSYSVATPATTSEVGSVRDAPIARSTHNNFLGGLKAQLRAWAASSTPQKEAPRSSTLTRQDTVRIAGDSDSESFAAYRGRRNASPPPFFMMPEQYQTKRKEPAVRVDAKENVHPTTGRRTAAEDHPAYRTRGRKTSRIAS